MIHQLFRDQIAQEKSDQIKDRLTKEAVYREVMVAREKADDEKDIRTFKEISAKRNEQLQQVIQIQRKQEIEQQKIKEEEFAKKLEENEKANIRQQSLRKQLKNTPEIRELEKQMLMARVTRDQMMQRAQVVATQKLKKQEEQETAKKLVEKIKKDELLLQENKKQKKAIQKEYHKALDDQVNYLSFLNESRSKEIREEREVINKIMEKIYHEDVEAERKQAEKKLQYRKQMVDYMKLKDELDKIEERNRQLDEAKAEGFILMQEYRLEERDRQKRVELESKLKKQEFLLKRLERIEQEKAYEENLRTELIIVEKELADQNREKLEAERQALQKEEMKEMFAKQILIRQQQKKLEKKEDELFAKSMLENLYEEDKLATLSVTKKMEKQWEHRKIILDMIKDRKERKRAEKQREMNEYLQQQNIEKEKEELIEQERKRILRENAELLDILPNFILKKLQTS